MGKKETVFFKTCSGIEEAIDKDLYEKILESQSKHKQLEKHIVAGEYFPSIMQVCVTLAMLFNGYTSFVAILSINLITGMLSTLLWNNLSLYKIPGLSFISYIIGNFVIRFFLDCIIVSCFDDWRIFGFYLIARFITAIVKIYIVDAHKLNNKIANYVLNNE